MHSYVCCPLHCVFATKERYPFIRPDLATRLWPYLGGIARENKMTALAIGGMPDHVHILLSLPSTISIAKAVQLIKGNSSKWIHETFREPELRDFGWQEGYGAFAVGISGIPATRNYIAQQEKHHHKKTFREEMESFLKKHGMAWSPYDANDADRGS